MADSGQNSPHFSDDGQWWWTGSQWIPASQAASAAPVAAAPTSQNPPRFSDDRQWWWTGSDWVPASQAPSVPVPSLGPPGSSPLPHAGARPIAPTAMPGRVPSWLAILGLLLCFPVGIVLTLLTSWATRTKLIAIGVVVALAVVGGIASASSLGASQSANVARNTPSAAPTQQAASPSASAPASQPAQPQFRTFGNGIWVVGKDIQPGTYRTRHDSAGCYFARLRGFGGTLDEIIANENSDSRLVVTIAASDKGFESDNCDTWSSDLSAITDNKTSFGDGDFILGTDMQPGMYRDTGGTGCYYARLRGFGHTIADIISNNLSDNVAVVTIARTDKGFESHSCGTWTKIG